MTLSSDDGYVFAGRFDGSGGDIDVSPLMPGLIGRQYRYNEPVYDVTANLSVTDFRKVGTIVIPSGKQHNDIRMDGTVSGGTKFKGIDFNYNVTDTIDAYCAIGALHNFGSGSTKAIFGAAFAESGCTGICVGGDFAVHALSGSTANAIYGVQIGLNGDSASTVVASMNGILIGTSNSATGTNDGVIVVDHGILSENEVGYDDAFIKAFNFTQTDTSGDVQQAGSFLKWQAPGAVLFEVDQNGAIIKRNPANRVLFQVDSGGDVTLGNSTETQKTISFVNSARTFNFQAIDTGDHFRIRDVGATRDLFHALGGAAGATNGIKLWVDGALKVVSAGAADSESAGFKSLRVPN